MYLQLGLNRKSLHLFNESGQKGQSASGSLLPELRLHSTTPLSAAVVSPFQSICFLFVTRHIVFRDSFFFLKSVGQTKRFQILGRYV